MHKVLYNEGAQTIRWVPMDLATGRPIRLTGTPAATYSVEDLRYIEESDSRTVDSGNATLDSVSTSVTSAVGASTANPRSISLANLSGIEAGRRYEIADQTGTDREIVYVQSVDALGLSALLATPLRHDYAQGAAFRGIEITASFNATDANDENRLHNGGGPFAVIWNYTANGRPYSVVTELWLTRYSVVPPINEADLFLASPDLADQSRNRYSPNTAIAFATSEVLADLGDQRINMDYHLSPSFAPTVRDRALLALAEWMRDVEAAERFEKRYERRLRGMTLNQAAIGSADIEPEDNIAPAGDSTKRRGWLAHT